MVAPLSLAVLKIFTHRCALGLDFHALLVATLLTPFFLVGLYGILEQVRTSIKFEAESLRTFKDKLKGCAIIVAFLLYPNIVASNPLIERAAFRFL